MHSSDSHQGGERWFLSVSLVVADAIVHFCQQFFFIFIHSPVQEIKRVLLVCVLLTKGSVNCRVVNEGCGPDLREVKLFFTAWWSLCCEKGILISGRKGVLFLANFRFLLLAPRYQPHMNKWPLFFFRIPFQWGV